jgi:uncharacterized protein (DUF2147 family)
MVATWNKVTRTGLAAFGLTLGTAGMAVAAPKDPSGTWLTEDGRARIRVEKCGARQSNICGYVVWMKTPTENGEPRLDRRNPDPNKTSRPLLGHQLMMGLRANADENYQGLIYNNEDGKSYNVTVWVEGAGLKVKGCLVAFLCSTQDWTRASDVLPGQLAGVTGSANGPKPDPEWASKPVAASGGQGQGETVKADARPKPRP